MLQPSLREPKALRSSLLFNPWLTCTAEPAVKLTNDLMLAYEEGTAASRKRKLKARDRENFRAVLHAIIANVALAVASKITPPTVAVSMRAASRKVTRYERPGFTAVRNVIAWLESAGVVTLSTSRKYRVASAITASENLVGELGGVLGREHFGEAPGRETILLSRRIDKDYVTGETSSERRAYADHRDADRYRSEMAIINAALSKSDVKFVDDGGPPVITAAPPSLSRYFNFRVGDPDRFDLGGRLFGGWWENLSKDRRRHIRIDGEPIADLDFSSMAVRLAYLEAGAEPPEGDLYAGLLESRWREGVKTVMLALLFRETPLTRLPADAKGELPADASAQSVRSAILAAHPALSKVFERGVGLKLMFAESQILVAALMKLAASNISALPLHDGIMTAASKAEAVRQTMSDAAFETMGYRLPITRKA